MLLRIGKMFEVEEEALGVGEKLQVHHLPHTFVLAATKVVTGEETAQSEGNPGVQTLKEQQEYLEAF